MSERPRLIAANSSIANEPEAVGETRSSHQALFLFTGNSFSWRFRETFDSVAAVNELVLQAQMKEKAVLDFQLSVSGRLERARVQLGALINLKSSCRTSIHEERVFGPLCVLLSLR